MTILTPKQHAQWEDEGYLLIPEFLPTSLVRACADAIWDFLQMSPDDPESWYRGPNPDNLPYVLPRKKGALLGLTEIDLAAVQFQPGRLPNVVVYGGFGGGFVEHGGFLGRAKALAGIRRRGAILSTGFNGGNSAGHQALAV